MELRLARIRHRARTHTKERFDNLFSHLDGALLLWAYEQLEEGKAAGVDGVSMEEYGEGLEGRIDLLLGRLHRGTYRPQPSRRRWIPKGDGRMRPLGIPTIEDKIVQRGLAALLTEVYKEEFCDLLGFTHYCGTSREGRFKLKWRSTKRLRAKSRAMREWLRSTLCMPLAELWQSVNPRLRGHDAYFNVSDNWSGVMEYRRRVEAALFWALNRRSQSRSFNWAEFFSYTDRHGLAMPGRVVNLNPVPSV